MVDFSFLQVSDVKVVGGGSGGRACKPRMLFDLTIDLFHNGKQFKYYFMCI